MYDHAFVLCGREEPYLRPVLGGSTGHVGVLLFFFISGHLISQSYRRRPDARLFFKARALRLLPGLWVNLLLSVVLLAPLSSAASYLAQPSTWAYLLNGLIFKCVFEIPSVFTTHPIKAVNGSLWTLQYEVLCYITLWVLLFAGLRCRLTLGKVLLGLVVGLLLANVLLALQPSHVFPSIQMWRRGFSFGYFETRPLTEWMLAFMLGALANQPLLLRFLQKWGFAGLLIASLGGWVQQWSLGFLVLVLSWGAGLFFLAYYPKGLSISQLLKGRDYSYGLYIYAFPVQQVVVAVFGPSPLYVGLLGLVGTGFFAVLSWHYIEKPALRLKG